MERKQVMRGWYVITFCFISIGDEVNLPLWMLFFRSLGESCDILRDWNIKVITNNYK